MHEHIADALGRKKKIFEMKDDETMGVVIDAAINDEVVQKLHEIRDKNQEHMNFEMLSTLPGYLKNKYY